MNLIYKIFFDKLNKNNSLGSKGSIEVYLRDNLKFLIGRKKNNIKVFIKKKKVILGLIFYGLPYLGLSYSKGYWTTNNLKKLLQLGLLNKNIFRANTSFNIFSKFYFYFINIFEKNTISKSKKQISFHYDLGNNFYKLWLDRSMTYSSAIFTKSNNLINAQKDKYQSITKIGKINEKHSILEIGCGWGGFIKYVEKNIGSHVTGITLSKEQFEYINSLRLNGSTVQLKDYRNIKKQFDRIVSIEMFEAVGRRSWGIYFNKLRECITDKGKIILQIITISEENYNYYANRKDFIQKYIFPGGMLPTKSLLKNYAKNNNLIFKEHLSFGKDYAKTLSIWRNNFLLNWSKVKKLGYDENFKRLWEYYLTYCEVGFTNGSIDVSQFLLEKKKNI